RCETWSAFPAVRHAGAGRPAASDLRSARLQAQNCARPDSSHRRQLPRSIVSERKKSRAMPCSKNCVDPISPEKLDLLLFDGVTLLVRVRVPPETWTNSSTSRLA